MTRHLALRVAAHLIPKEREGRNGPKVELCAACHLHVHQIFSNRELAEELDGVEKLRARPEVRTFLRWVRKQDPGKRIRVLPPRRWRR